jgi:hypothetical protein
MSPQQPSRGPDYGIAKILRGFPNFEDIYQGLSRGIPIALSEYGSKTMGRERNAAANYAAISGALSKQTLGGDPVDSANVDGIHSPNLVDGLPTVFGSNCVFLFPRVQTDNEGSPLQPTYKLIWRVRGIDSFAKTQLPYHTNLRGFRYSDTHVTSPDGFSGPAVLTGAAAQRAVIATTEETIRFTSPRSTEPTLSNLGYQAANDLVVQPQPPYGEIRSFVSGDIVSNFVQGPILPFVGGNAELNVTTGKPYVYADLGQNPISSATGLTGLPIANTARAQVSHVSYSTVAKGDEVIILVYNLLEGATLEELGTYDFDDGTDFQFSCMFGRGGYRADEGNLEPPLFPNGVPFGVYLIQGHS